LGVMAEAGILESILPARTPPSEIRLPKMRDPILRLAALHAPAEETADRLRLSRQQRERLVSLEREPGLDLTNLERELYFHGGGWVTDRLHLMAADEKLLESAKRWERPTFPLDGEDAIRLGLAGKAIGEALRKVERLWIDSGFKLDRDELLNALSGESSERVHR
jgi:poly(A) polymerase